MEKENKQMDKSTIEQEVVYTELTEEDVQYIEDMEVFYEITREEALERFMTGNIDGVELSEEDIEFIKEKTK